MTIASKTIYERIQYIYSCNKVKFLAFKKQSGSTLEEEEVWDLLKKTSDFALKHKSDNLVVKRMSHYLSFERNDNGITTGFITPVFEPSLFDVWFVDTMLQNGTISFQSSDVADLVKGIQLSDKHLICEKIVGVFETTIKHAARVDEWSKGREVFFRNLEFFVSRGLPIEAVLPAFPCKSSNPDKVSGTVPDKGEELAIKQIINFVNLVRDIYPPGMKFFIVSDGHVFSDCINVDDSDVDSYTEELKKLYDEVKPNGFEGIYFRGLNDCFTSKMKSVVELYLLEVTVDHFIETQLDNDTEINRKILMVGCDNNVDLLRRHINTPHHPRLYLYRGFNRFMLDDLILYQKKHQLSRKKYKKLVSQVAFEMIRRNDAYSNLVELIFPFHLRLSIHAHPNCGPKFGIRLLNPKVCAAQGHNQDDEDRLLHIPTPWHNTIFKVKGVTKLVIGSSKIAKEYGKNPDYTGGWNVEERCYEFEKV